MLKWLEWFETPTGFRAFVAFYWTLDAILFVFLIVKSHAG